MNNTFQTLQSRIIELEVENKALKRTISVCTYAMQGYLDNIEFDNTSDVIEKSEVIRMIKEELKSLQKIDIQREIYSLTDKK